jgi:DtxR family Mn-dependent transcriptional regulator
MKSELSSTLEDYLEAIYRLENEKRAARVRDISQYLGVAKSTVNAALKSLSAKGLIAYEPYQLIVLTEKGKERASEIVLYHEVMRHFLSDILAIERERAEHVACEMEHAVDRDVIERFACFLAFIENSDGAEESWVNRFRDIVTDKSRNGESNRIIKEYLAKFDASGPFP